MEQRIETTKGGHTIALKEVTGRTKREYRRIALKAEETADVADKIDQLEDALFELFVESVDGKTDDVKGLILNLPPQDYQQVVDICREVLAGFQLEKKSDER